MIEKDFGLDDITFQICKSFKRKHRRARIDCKGKRKFTVILTDQERDMSIRMLASVLNHEFLHWLLYYFAGTKYWGKKYDKFLEVLELYYAEVLEMEML